MANTTFSGPVRSQNGFQTVSINSTTGAVTVTSSTGDATVLGNQALSGAGAVSLTTTLTSITSTGAAEALTLANGTVGQVKVIAYVVDGGSSVLTPTTALGFTTITFSTAGQSATLVYTSAGWAITALNGAVAA